MNQVDLTTISDDMFEQLIQGHIAWAAAWDGVLSDNVFFGIWTAYKRPPLQLQAQLVDGQLKFIAPPESYIKVIDNRIYLDNGLELVINL
jgi:hypothetical protein